MDSVYKSAKYETYILSRFLSMSVFLTVNVPVRYPHYHQCYPQLSPMGVGQRLMGD